MNQSFLFFFTHDEHVLAGILYFVTLDREQLVSLLVVNTLLVVLVELEKKRLVLPRNKFIPNGPGDIHDLMRRKVNPETIGRNSNGTRPGKSNRIERFTLIVQSLGIEQSP